MKLKFGSFSRLFFRSDSVTDAEIEFHNYAEYAPKYEELARVLAHSGKKPHIDELALIRRLMATRPPRPGSLSLGDTLFLPAMTSILSPERVIEVGTGTGFSSAPLSRRRFAAVELGRSQHVWKRSTRTPVIAVTRPLLSPLTLLRLSRSLPRLCEFMHRTNPISSRSSQDLTSSNSDSSMPTISIPARYWIYFGWRE